MIVSMCERLRFAVTCGGRSETVEVPVATVLDFGYAGRDQDAVRAHVAELGEPGG